MPHWLEPIINGFGAVDCNDKRELKQMKNEKQKEQMILKSMNLCGKIVYFPECDVSRGLCVMKKKKTLSQHDIDFLKEYFDIEAR